MERGNGIYGEVNKGPNTRCVIACRYPRNSSRLFHLLYPLTACIDNSIHRVYTSILIILLGFNHKWLQDQRRKRPHITHAIVHKASPATMRRNLAQSHGSASISSSARLVLALSARSSVSNKVDHHGECEDDNRNSGDTCCDGPSSCSQAHQPLQDYNAGYECPCQERDPIPQSTQASSYHQTVRLDCSYCRALCFDLQEQADIHHAAG